MFLMFFFDDLGSFYHLEPKNFMVEGFQPAYP